MFSDPTARGRLGGHHGARSGSPRGLLVMSLARYLGVDVTVAARLAQEAGADEVLVSDRLQSGIDQDAFELKRKRRFKVKGVPRELETYAIARKS